MIDAENSEHDFYCRQYLQNLLGEAQSSVRVFVSYVNKINYFCEVSFYGSKAWQLFLKSY